MIIACLPQGAKRRLEQAARGRCLAERSPPSHACGVSHIARPCSLSPCSSRAHHAAVGDVRSWPDRTQPPPPAAAATLRRRLAGAARQPLVALGHLHAGGLRAVLTLSVVAVALGCGLTGFLEGPSAEVGARYRSLFSPKPPGCNPAVRRSREMKVLVAFARVGNEMLSFCQLQ